MNKLIIITGVSGTGKTTLAKMLYAKINNSTLLSYDELTEGIYDMVGFKDKDEKEKLKLLNIEIYKKLIEECMSRNDEVIIIEKPFKIEWKEYLENSGEQYGYKIYTINMYAKNFDTIWNRLIKREKNKEDRHPAHYLNSYYLKNREEYRPIFEYNYNTLKKEYNDLCSNNINLGKIINIRDIEEINLEKLIKKILK